LTLALLCAVGALPLGLLTRREPALLEATPIPPCPAEPAAGTCSEQVSPNCVTHYQTTGATHHACVEGPSSTCATGAACDLESGGPVPNPETGAPPPEGAAENPAGAPETHETSPAATAPVPSAVAVPSATGATTVPATTPVPQSEPCHEHRVPLCHHARKDTPAEAKKAEEEKKKEENKKHHVSIFSRIRDTWNKALNLGKKEEKAKESAPPKTRRLLAEPPQPHGEEGEEPVAQPVAQPVAPVAQPVQNPAAHCSNSYQLEEGRMHNCKHEGSVCVKGPACTAAVH